MEVVSIFYYVILRLFGTLSCFNFIPCGFGKKHTLFCFIVLDFPVVPFLQKIKIPHPNMILLIFSSIKVSNLWSLEEIFERAFAFSVAGVSIKAKFSIEILLAYI